VAVRDAETVARGGELRGGRWRFCAAPNGRLHWRSRLADISGLWDLDAATRALTRFADLKRRRSASLPVTRDSRDGGELRSAIRRHFEAETGLVILAMGKAGAFELKLLQRHRPVVFYDADRFPFRKKADARAAPLISPRGW